MAITVVFGGRSGCLLRFQSVSEVNPSFLGPLEHESIVLARHWCHVAVTLLSQAGFKADMFYPIASETIVTANVDMAFPHDPQLC